MAINTAHSGYGLSFCHGSLLQIRLTGYKREECVASQPIHEVVHTPLQHEQSSPQLQLLGASTCFVTVTPSPSPSPSGLAGSGMVVMAVAGGGMVGGVVRSVKSK